MLPIGLYIWLNAGIFVAKKRESMDIQSVPKVGISSVVHSKHIDPGSIDVVGNDIALFDTESVISLYNGPSKLEVVSIGLCLEVYSF